MHLPILRFRFWFAVCCCFIVSGYIFLLLSWIYNSNLISYLIKCYHFMHSGGFFFHSQYMIFLFDKYITNSIFIVFFKSLFQLLFLSSKYQKIKLSIINFIWIENEHSSYITKKNMWILHMSSINIFKKY